jgi:alcohol dehydrogenase
MWDEAIDIYQVREIRSRGTIYFGVGAIDKINYILEKLKSSGISKVIVITGANSHKISGAWAKAETALKNSGLEYIISSNVEPNPTTNQIDASVKTGLDFGAEAVLAIGGGSVIDSAKSIAVLLKYSDKTSRQLYEKEFVPQNAVPIVAINLTHGTGSEADRFAVVTVTETGNKMAVGYDMMYPLYSIVDPFLMTKLSREQTLYVSIDAFNHAFESATTNNTSPYSVSLSKETIRLIAKYLPMALENPENLKARYFLAYAAMSVGFAFDCSGLHITHAIAKFLNNLKPEFPHGLSLTILLPSVIKHCYPQKAVIIADILQPVIPDLQGASEEAERVATAIEKWLFGLGLTQKLEDCGITETDIPALVDICMNFPALKDLQAVTPMKITAENIEQIYRESL